MTDYSAVEAGTLTNDPETRCTAEPRESMCPGITPPNMGYEVWDRFAVVTVPEVTVVLSRDGETGTVTVRVFREQRGWSAPVEVFKP